MTTLEDLKIAGSPDLAFYIQGVASACQVDLDEIDLRPLLRDGRAVEKKDVNKFFFDLIAERKEAVAKEVPVSIKSFLESKRGFADAEETALRDRILEGRAEIDSFYAKIEAAISEIRASEIALEGLKLAHRSVYDVVKPLLEKGVWEVNTSWESTERVAFKRTAPVILSHLNRAAQVDIKVNVGKPVVVIDLRDRSVPRILGESLEPIIVSLNGSTLNWHPHVDNTGKPCFGTAGSRIQEELSKGDFVRAFEIIDSWLATYNPQSPYHDLTSYALTYYECSGPSARVVKDEGTGRWRLYNGPSFVERDEDEENDYEEDDYEEDDV